VTSFILDFHDLIRKSVIKNVKVPNVRQTWSFQGQGQYQREIVENDHISAKHCHSLTIPFLVSLGQ